MTDIEQKLHEVITNIIDENNCRCLDDEEDRAGLRDSLMSALVLTFSFRMARTTD